MKIPLLYNNIPPLEKRTSNKTVSKIEISLWLLFIVAIIYKTAHFQFSVNLNERTPSSDSTLCMLAGSLASALLIAAAVLLLSNKKRLTVLITVDIFMSVLLLADSLYFKYYYNVISVPVLAYIGLIPSVSSSVKSLFNPSDLLYFIDIPIMLAGIFFMKHRNKPEKNAISKLSLSTRLITAVLIIAASSGIFFTAYSKVPASNFIYDNNYVVNSLGVFYFHYYDCKRFINERIFADDDITTEEKARVEQFFVEKNSSQPEVIKYAGAAEGKNLIVIQLEAIQNLLINRKLDGREITPNLNSFINDSAYFDNFFYQIGGGNTSDAEFLTNNSLHPLFQGAVYFRYPTNKYESTAKLLKEKGYGTYVFHANTPSFWNRTEMYKAEGFDRFFNCNDYDIDETLGWGLSDRSFFRQSLDKFDTSKPFYSFFITLSSHHPFTYFKDYKSFDTGKYENTYLGNYLKGASYVDTVIGEFLEEIKERGLYDNSVIVIYGDHNGFTHTQTDILKEFIGYEDSEFNWIMLQKTPCFIRFPGMDNKGVQQITAGEIDILPTIANLMGIEAPHTIGNDLFNTEEGSVVLRNSTVITDKLVYLYKDGIVLDREGNTLVKDEYIDEIEKLQEQLNISDIIVKKNGLKAIER